MENEFLDVEPILYLTGYYDESNPIKKEDLEEIYCVIYKVDSKEEGIPEKEVFTFTRIFEQAFKRFKIFPTGYAVIKRFLTDDLGLIKLGNEGTTKEWKETDVTPDIEEKLKHLKFSDLYGEIRTHNLDGPKENTIPVTYTFNKLTPEPEEESGNNQSELIQA